MLIIFVLLTELAKVILQIYCKMMTWPRGEEYYKNKKIITAYKMGKEIIAFGNNEVEKNKLH